MPLKDVTLPDVKKVLLLSKHADYIQAFEKDKDDYVCVGVCEPLGMITLFMEHILQHLLEIRLACALVDRIESCQMNSMVYHVKQICCSIIPYRSM